MAALAIGYLAVTGCDYNDYPIEATFCDDWCRVMRRTGCEQEPENCIRDCESALPSDRCLGLQSSLLDCYQSTPADQFECVGQGFQSTVRPASEICTEERHELIRCEVPRVMDCVEACVALDASDPSLVPAPDAGALPLDVEAASGASGEAMSAVGAPGSSDCAAPPFPCERLCWELDARFGRGRPTTLTSIDTSDDTDLAAIGEPLIRCAQARAAECRAGELPPAANAVAGATSWTGLFFDCAGLPVDFDLFD